MNTTHTRSNLRRRRLRAILTVALIAAICSLINCKKEASQQSSNPDAASKTTADTAPAEMLTWRPSDASIKTHDFRAPDASLRTELRLTPSEKFPTCAQTFETDKNPAKQFPLADDSRRALRIAGCAPEAYHRMEDGTRYIAYATPLATTHQPSEALKDAPPEGASDLRLLAYQPDGQLAWHAKMDRSANAKNFRANFRASYIAPLLPRLVCFGTVWQGGTQASCVGADDGAVAWSGMMPFWSGIIPQPNATSLVAATLKRLTRRYPYSGVEMDAVKFDNAGGRSSFYAASPDQFFFASAHAESPHLIAYGLDDFETQWTLELPAQPNPNWRHLFEEFDLLLLKIDDTLHALRASSGERLWAATIGKDESPVVALNGRLYLLLRRASGPNRLFDLNPQTGAVNTYSPLPNGTLELHAIEDSLILRGVRAVQQVIFSAEDAPEATP